MPTLREQLDKITGLKHRLAVWEAISAFLDDNFLSKDGRQAPKGLKVPDCAPEVVPESTVEDVMQAIGKGPIADLQEEIAAIENQEVVIMTGGRPNEAS